MRRLALVSLPPALKPPAVSPTKVKNVDPALYPTSPAKRSLR
jgi:hypothetical protein